jgi:hypothetical protein
MHGKGQDTTMPYIPEDPIDHVLAEVRDMREAVQIQTQAIGELSSILSIHGQWLVRIHAVVSKKPESDALGDLLQALIAADRHHAEVLQAVLQAVQKPAMVNGG